MSTSMFKVPVESSDWLVALARLLSESGQEIDRT